MSPTLIGCFLGVAQGMCHAVEPDHLAAVSTLVAEQQRTRSVLRFAAAWGAGHALVLLVVGGGLLLLGARMPPSLADACELVVACMLVLLGIRALRSARRSSMRSSTKHAHFQGAPVRRALAVGMVHGLAGSGAIATLVVARLMSPVSGLTFIALYGLGATLGMSVVAGVAGVPLAKLARGTHGASLMLRVTGVLSVVIGAAWAWPIARRWFSMG